VGLGDLEVDEQRSNALRSHAGAAIGMEREGPGTNALSKWLEIFEIVGAVNLSRNDVVRGSSFND
jgi:hypothetical protein